MYFNIDSIVIVSFLILILVVGLYHGRDVKTIEQYALGGRKFSTGTLVSTIVATWIGGDYLFITFFISINPSKILPSAILIIKNR